VDPDKNVCRNYRPFESCAEVSGVISGNLPANATRSQIAASSRFLPEAGVALILMPCLMIQNVRSSGGISSSARLGG
jgi:hypothetical protein